MEKYKNNKLVVKHNKLIEFKGKMGLNELKLFSLVIADIKEQQDKIFKKYEINIDILKQTTEHKDFYNYMQEIAFNLENKRIIVENINEKGKRESYPIRLINRPKIVEDSKFLELYIDKDLIPYVLNLKKHFTQYQIENILRLNSRYSIRLYEIMKRWEFTEKKEVEINLEELRNYLGVEEKYSRFYDFERWVLKVAKEEINKYTDLEIDYEKIKTRQSITSVLFFIRSKTEDEKVYIEFLNEFYDIKDMQEKMGLKNENFNSRQIMSIYEKAVQMAGNEDINLFEYVRLNYLHIKDNARNKYSYLLKSLENDYARAILILKYSTRKED
ncbi:replication initiation protein [Clostridium cochlearium]|uniref:replication initiation protein n=1 Tax=Clostridium cochlearium TaxID=1494 RepID=UPI0018056560|nr:replication initiation protein [Clostridium cochlearium]NMA58770.1 replication initiation protein [Clostridium cochlearium]